MPRSESPPTDRSRPRHKGGNGEKTSGSRSLDAKVTRPGDDLAHFEAGYRLGYATAYPIGWRHGGDDEAAAWSAILTGCTETFRWREHAELERARVIDWQPCPSKCRACSRCIASLSYWARGGRPYAGVQREAELAGVSG